MDNEPQYFQRWAGFFQIENHKTESIAQPEFSRYTFKSFAFLKKTLTITLSAMHQCNQSRLLSLLSMCLGLTMCNLFWYKFFPLTWGSTYFFSSHTWISRHLYFKNHLHECDASNGQKTAIPLVLHSSKGN